MGTITIVEANAVETRKGVGRETDTPRDRNKKWQVTQTTKEIEERALQRQRRTRQTER